MFLISHKMCAVMASNIMIKTIIVLLYITQSESVMDFTCHSKNPLIDINNDDNLRIGGYRSGDDKDSTVIFGRTSDTGTGSRLPPESYPADHSNSLVFARLLYMPTPSSPYERVQRIGAFHCKAEKGEKTEMITTIILNQSGDVTPQHITTTVNVGESVTLTVNTTKSNLRWRHNGGNPDDLANWNDSSSVTISYVDVNDTGIYECYEYGHRGTGKHAIMQLIVRSCRASKWGNMCKYDCPFCYNGGMCDDRSGECVCAPGFIGEQCQTVIGRNKWGQDGQVQCREEDDHGYGCRGSLFCLPHPYGCSCAAGFKGIDCNEECGSGTYGASCSSECHCNGGSCLKDTGECDSDGEQCATGWSGVNCQGPASAPRNIEAYHVFSNSFGVRWLEPPCGSRNGPIASYSYSLYQNDTEVTEGSVKFNEITFQDLTQFTNYTFRVAAETDAGIGPEAIMTVQTNEAGVGTNTVTIVVLVLSLLVAIAGVAFKIRLSKSRPRSTNTAPTPVFDGLRVVFVNRSFIRRPQSTNATPTPVLDEGQINSQDDDRMHFSPGGNAEKQDESSCQDVHSSNHPDDDSYEDMTGTNTQPHRSDSPNQQGDATYEVVPGASAQPQRSDQIEFSTDGYVKYKTGDEGAPYQGIYTEPSDPPKPESADYVNATVMKAKEMATMRNKKV